MSKLILGSQLSKAQQAEVKAAFIYRWTRENTQRAQVYKCALCDIRTPYENSKSANGHTHPTIPLISDEQWLAETAFWFTSKGHLDAHRTHSEPAYMVREEAAHERKA